MDKRLTAIALSLLVLVVFCSGCTREREAITASSAQNNPPTAIISTTGTLSSPPSYVDMTVIDAVAYTGDTITFDASASFDSDGYISSYLWIWEDNTNKAEKTAHRTFTIDNVYELQGLPLIYSIVLQVEDDHALPSLAEYRIGVIPKTHTFYLYEDSLQLQQPSEGKDSTLLTFGTLRSVQTLTYTLDAPLWIRPCNWNLTLFVEKPRYSPLTSVSATLLNDEGLELGRAEQQLPTLVGQKQVTVCLAGAIENKAQFSSVHLQFKGFSLRECVSILYGGEQASHLMFDFRL